MTLLNRKKTQSAVWLTVIGLTSIGFPTLGLGQTLTETYRALGINVCHDVVTQFKGLNAKANPLGFRRGVADDNSSVLGVSVLCKHYQGVHRYQGPGGRPYFFVTKSGNTTSSCSGGAWKDEPGTLVVVRMGSRDTDGERLRSNRLALNSRVADTEPPSADVAVRQIKFNGESYDARNNLWPAWCHPAAGQIVGDLLFIPISWDFVPNLETPELNDGELGGNSSAILIIDISNPESPTLVKQLNTTDSFGGTMGVTRLSDGTYLFAMQKFGDVIFRKSNGPDARDPNFGFGSSQRWDYTNDPDPIDIAAFREDNQAAQLIRDDDDQLYLLFLDDTDTVEIGRGKGALYRVELSHPNNDILEIVATREFGMKEPTTGDFDASGGAYITPTGQLLVYTTEHVSDGPGNSIRMGEFIYRDVNYPSNPGCHGWITFYEKQSGWDDPTSQSHTLDYQDRALDDWFDLGNFEDHSLDLNGFSNEAESIRWNLPPGRIAKLYDNGKASGTLLGTLIGDGLPHAMESLGSANDRISSVIFEDKPSVLRMAFSDPDGFPRNEGTLSDPYIWPLTKITRVNETMGAPPCFSLGTLILEAGKYSEGAFYPTGVVLERPMKLMSNGGAVTILGP